MHALLPSQEYCLKVALPRLLLLPFRISRAHTNFWMQLCHLQLSVPPGKLTCATTSVTLSAATYADGAYYYWTAADGSSITNAQSSSITVTKPGKYYLTSSAMVGCTETKDSVIVLQDIYKPTASAFASNIITPTRPSATLVGGDTIASKYSNTNGSYQGLTWNWIGPGSFTSSVQRPPTSTPGIYMLIVTEISNGCKDTAMTNVLDQSSSVLAASKIKLAANNSQSGKVNLSWTLDGEPVTSFELFRSTDGTSFQSIAKFAANVTVASYKVSYEDALSGISANQLLYRVEYTTATGKIGVSNIEKVGLAETKSNVLNIYPNPVVNVATLTFYSITEGQAQVQLINGNGQVVYQASVKVNIGTNNIKLGGFANLGQGVYGVRMANGVQIHTNRILIAK